MKITVACLAILFPFMSGAVTPEPTDKYLDCNCHVTPGLPWKPAKVRHKISHVKHKIMSTEKTTVSEAPPSAPKQRPVMQLSHNYTPATNRDTIIHSNKLALPAGKSIYADGELVYISGRVLDKKCVPVSDAIIDIWQTDPEGHYVKSTLGERLSPHPTFAGSGRATTDNLGRFNFVTIFPGAVAGRAPFIHVHVTRKDFPALDTEMFFSEDKRNNTDPVYTSLSPIQQTALTAKVWQRDVNNPDEGLAAAWDISLDGTNRWRHF